MVSIRTGKCDGYVYKLVSIRTGKCDGYVYKLVSIRTGKGKVGRVSIWSLVR